MKYFENFQLIPYSFASDPNNIFYVKNIFERVSMLDSVISNINVYYQYSMKDSDTFESIAYKYYGDANRFWVILFTNKVLDPFYDAPLKYNQFINYINAKYGSFANAQGILDHYEKRITKTITNTANGYVSSNTTSTYYANNTYSIDGSTYLPTIPSNPIITLTPPPNVVIANNTTVTETVNLVAVSAYDTEEARNESRRNIFLIKKDYISQIENELRKLLTQ